MRYGFDRYLTLADGQTRQLRDDAHVEVLRGGVIWITDWDDKRGGPRRDDEAVWLAPGE